MKLPHIGPAYQFENKPLAAQECVNYYLEIGGKDTREPVALRGCPGLKAWGSAVSSGIRGMAAFNGILYVVAGTQFYVVDASGVATAKGTVSGSWRAYMEFNGTQIIIADRQLGFLDGYMVLPGTTTTGYVYTLATGDVAQIADADFAIASDNQYFLSNIDDATAYLATDLNAMNTTKSDCVGVLSTHDQVVLFSSDAIEFHINVGDLDFPFRKQGGAVIERGAIEGTMVMADNTFAWLGTDRCAYMASGFQDIKISTPAIDEAFAGYDITGVSACYYVWRGHKFYCITFPNSSVTWECDLTLPPQWGWHKRESWNLGRWRGSHIAHCYGKTLVADYSGSDIYEMDAKTYTENGDTLEARRTSQFIHADNQTFICDLIELVLQTGETPLTTGQGSKPKIELSLSKDGARSFGSYRTRSLGEQGQHDLRGRWRNNGKCETSLVIRSRITDPVPRDIVGATGIISLGN